MPTLQFCYIHILFVRPHSACVKSKEKTQYVRQFSIANLNNFKIALGGTDWSPVLNSTNVETAYDVFWSSYNDLYELTFPKKKIRLNSNFHKRCPLMTNGLVISRQNKNKLYKMQLVNNSPENVA
jgi:hypothetical protein